VAARTPSGGAKGIRERLRAAVRGQPAVLLDIVYGAWVLLVEIAR
jgi:hypothetical protein